MIESMKTVVRKYFVNGNIDDEFVEVDEGGTKVQYVKGEDGKPKLGEDGKPVKYTKKQEDDGSKALEVAAKASLEDLAKVNPAIAELLGTVQTLTEAEKIRKQKEDEDAEAGKKSKGEFESLYGEEKTKRTVAETELAKRHELVGKYQKTIGTILATALKEIPVEKQKLIPNVSDREKLEYILANAEYLGAKVVVKKGEKVDNNDDAPAATELSKSITRFNELVALGAKRTHADSTEMTNLSRKIKDLQAAAKAATK